MVIVPNCPNCGTNDLVKDKRNRYVKKEKRQIVLRCERCLVEWLFITNAETVEQIIAEIRERVDNFKL